MRTFGVSQVSLVCGLAAGIVTLWASGAPTLLNTDSMDYLSGRCHRCSYDVVEACSSINPICAGTRRHCVPDPDGDGWCTYLDTSPCTGPHPCETIPDIICSS
jgi:hypothetical protein